MTESPKLITLLSACGTDILVDPNDVSVLSRYSWSLSYARKGVKRTPYAHARIAGKWTYMHRFLTDAAHGVLVDHIDGNGLNNTRGNLRLCSAADNTRYRLRHGANSLGFYGIGKSTSAKMRPSYYAQIAVGPRRISICGFPTPEDAARAYDDLAREYHGAFASLNFPGGE